MCPSLRITTSLRRDTVVTYLAGMDLWLSSDPPWRWTTISSTTDPSIDPQGAVGAVPIVCTAQGLEPLPHVRGREGGAQSVPHATATIFRHLLRLPRSSLLGPAAPVVGELHLPRAPSPASSIARACRRPRGRAPWLRASFTADNSRSSHRHHRPALSPARTPAVGSGATACP